MNLHFVLFYFITVFVECIFGNLLKKLPFLCTRFWMAARVSILGCKSERSKMKKMKAQQPPRKKNLQNLFCIQLWVCFSSVSAGDPKGSVLVILRFCCSSE